jgi:hypothetical protein
MKIENYDSTCPVRGAMAVENKSVKTYDKQKWNIRYKLLIMEKIKKTF